MESEEKMDIYEMIIIMDLGTERDWIFRDKRWID
jgi:hypothetical protein